jgi:hypothetical protein
MGHSARLQLVGRVFTSLSVNKRNLYEISVILFVICMASQLRALPLAGNQASGAGKREMAA